jgi:putative ABC transport system permease protein
MDPQQPPGSKREAIDAELEFHFAEMVDALIEDGWTEADARAEAVRRFGDRDRYRRDLHAIGRRDTRRVPMNATSSEAALTFDSLIRDVRYACRALLRTPGFTLTAVLTLALGIGANGAVFSALNTVLLQPLAFPDADRLVRINEVRQRSGEVPIAPVRLGDWIRLNDTFESMTGYYVEDVSETSGEFPDRVRRAFVAPRFNDVWGVHPARGRTFNANEHSTTGTPAVLISDRFWRTRLGADPDVLNRTVRIDASVVPIVGVMPASFRFPDRGVDLWFPIATDFKAAQSRRNTWYTGVGRLKPGVTTDQARANLATVQTQLGQQYPDTDRDIGIALVPLKEVVLGDIGPSLWVLFGGVSLVLLITCTNIAGLLLSRSAHRQQEIAVRMSLGASRARIAIQLLIETLVLSLSGSGVGLAVAALATMALRSAAADLPRMDEIGINRIVVMYTFAISVIVTALCGVLPAIRVGRAASGRSLVDGTRTQVSTRRPLQWALVGAQVAMSVVLLVGAGLLVRSVDALGRIDPGFKASGVLTFRVSGNFGETTNYNRLQARIDGTIDAMRALPGVANAATTVSIPGVPRDYTYSFRLAEAQGDATRPLDADRRIVSPEYFATMGIAVIEGEVCPRQQRDGPRTVLINQAFRSRYLSDWPSPIGLHLAASENLDQGATIVGVTADARDGGIDRAPVPAVYSCFSTPNPTPYFLVRTHGDPTALAQTVRVTMREREPLRSVYDISSLEERIGGAFTRNRLRTNVLTLFALTALALAGLGLYGTLSYVVNLRRREVGLRLALGAMRTTIVRQFLKQGLTVIAIGCAVGIVLALMATRMLEGMLFGVTPADPIVTAAVIAIVMAVAAVGSLIPAVRASLIDPMRVLRDE